MRMAVMDPYDNIKFFIDNSVPKAVHCRDMLIHTYLIGDAYTVDLKINTADKRSGLIAEGDKMSFVYEGRSYYVTVVTVVRSEVEVSVTCWGLTLELTNEEVDATTSRSLQTMEQYLRDLGFESEVIRIGVNEVASEQRYLAFDQRESILKRMYSLAEAFGAEISFDAVLKDNYALDHIKLSIFKTGDRRGAGTDRTDRSIRYGTGVQSIEKTSDISELYTCIRPRGKSRKVTRKEKTGTYRYSGGAVSNVLNVELSDDSMIEKRFVEKYGDWVETRIDVTYLDDGKPKTVLPTKFYKSLAAKPAEMSGTIDKRWGAESTREEDGPVMLGGFGQLASDENGQYILTDAIGGSADIRAPWARDKFPSALTKKADGTFADGYIVKYYEDSNAEDQGTLWEGALAELKKSCVPKVSYTLTGRVEGSVGDWLMVEDTQYDPPVYLQCRIVEQETDPDNPANCRTTFDNFTEFKSQISQDIQAQISALIQSAAAYDCAIVSESSTVYKSDEDVHSFHAAVRQSGSDTTSKFRIAWSIGGARLDDGSSVTIAGSQIGDTSVLTFTAYEGDKIRGSAAVTLQKVIIPTISQEVNADGSLTIKTESAGVISSHTLANGKDGVTFTPSVSSSGVLAWTNNGGLNNPAAVNIKGKDGAPGVGISSVSARYYQSSSSSAPSQTSSSWSTTMPSTLTAGYYLHTQIRVYLTDGSVQYYYAKSRNGTDGTNGVGISSIVTKYYQSSSSTAPSQSSSSWSTTMPSTLTAGYYLHTQIAITLTSGSISYYYQKTRNGSNSTSTTVVNNLTSTSTTSALSAAQGKKLWDTLNQVILKRDFTATCTTTGPDQLVQVPFSLPSGYVPLAAVNVATNGFVSHFYVESFSTTTIRCWGNTQSGKSITVSMLFIRDDLY